MSRQRSAQFSSTFRELVGSVADLGTLLPLLVGLIAFNGIAAGTALALVGVTYILTGGYYRIPVPVQPLKAAAMIAIATGASAGQVRAAALWMAGIMLFLAATKLPDRMYRVFPRVLIHGLQAGLGLMMISIGVKFVCSYPASLGTVMHGPAVTHLKPFAGFLPSGADFAAALFLMVLPQVPLSLANSVVATRDCAIRYFGPAGDKVTARRLSATMGLGNLAAGLLGGMPMCHGAGGMTSHYHFGARTGAATVMIGTLLLALGLGASHWTAGLLPSVPTWVLGIPLAYAGVRHAMLAKESLSTPANALIVLSMGAVALLQGNLLAAFGIGLIVKIVIHGYQELSLRRA